MEQIDQSIHESIEANAFNAHDLLSEFRHTMVETGQIFKGPVKVSHTEELGTYLSDAEAVAEAQVERMKGMLPPDVPESFLGLAESYIEGFTRLVRGMGISALRLAGKGNEQFVAVLRSPALRQNVLRSLATDYRLIIWHLGNESTEDVNSSTFKQYAALYRPGSIAKELREEFPQFLPGNFKGAVLGRPKNPKGFMRAAAAKIEELSAVSAYEDMPPSSIKHAVFAHTSNPEAYLDKVISTVEELSSDPHYADFGMRAIRYVAEHYTKTSPKLALDKAIAKAEQLHKTGRYREVPPSLIKNVVLMSPVNVDAVLGAAVSTIASLTADPRYDIFGAGDITQAVLFHPKDTGSFLEKARQRYDTFRANPRYAAVSDGRIKDVVLNRTTNPQKFLDRVLEKIAQLAADPVYGEFGKGYITDAVFGRPSNPEAYLDKVLEKIAAYQADPVYAGLELKTIRYAVINHPNEVEKFLRQMIANQ